MPFILAVLAAFGALALFLRARKLKSGSIFWSCVFPAAICAGYLFFFFRDPERKPPGDPAAIVAGADGRVTSVTMLREDQYLKADCVRISIFLSLFDVHVNRASFPTIPDSVISNSTRAARPGQKWLPPGPLHCMYPAVSRI